MKKKNPMKKKTSNRCKTKDCNNIVIEGKYCMYCDRKRKEARTGIMDGAGKAVFMAGNMFLLKPSISKAPKMAAGAVKVAKTILKK